ncbi:hypothetical protein BWQ96_10182 [Gracilariopsis chorda]|uniref:Ribosomal eL28/Mak16 domain-containing protein n=1 Tax=Gracilariopsis chorda TaxID=448386 RepID=A0A2V3IDE9_9FLOR|nr:hypothetical protein BWQ96_10182 [Gracilariopsis chorda]|eukprot:PXF40106.1 hypothetical protein BWQ96_10182 [Gracilariopsis chorda]
MSEALLWQLIRKNNSRTLCSRNPRTARTYEKGSLRNLISKTDSGFCNITVVNVSANEDGLPVLSLKNRKPEARRNPDKMWRTITLSGGVRKALARTDKLLTSYAPSKKKDALRKVSAIYKAYARKNKGVDHTKFIATE